MKLIDNLYSKVRGRVQTLAKETVEKTAPVVEREIKKITAKSKEELIGNAITMAKVALVVCGGLYLVSSIDGGAAKAATEGPNIVYNIRITNNYYGAKPV